MPFTIESIPVASEFGVTIQNKLLLNDVHSGRLLAMLPGHGYTNDHPVMHYLMNVALAQGYDVLRIEYGFQAARVPSGSAEPVKMAVILQESKNALEQVLARGGYTHLCIAAKSMGTPLAVVMMPELQVPAKALILLTPIQNAADMTGDVRTLAVIGTADPAYNASQKLSDTVRWRIHPGLNHSLELEGNWQKSLFFLSEIMTDCAEFLKV